MAIKYTACSEVDSLYYIPVWTVWRAPMLSLMLTSLLDFGSALLFLFVFLATNNIYLATGIGIAAAIATLAWTWIRHRRVGVLQGLGPAIVLAMGCSSQPSSWVAWER
jgi:hypothetical protein